MFRLDKNTPRGTGGEVILYVNESYTALACHKLNELEMESSTWSSVADKLQSNENLLVGLCYGSPNSTEENNKKLRQQIANIKTVQNVSHLLL